METAIESYSRQRRQLKPAELAALYHAAALDIRALVAAAESSRDLAIVSIRAAVEARLAVGMKLLEIKEAFSGEFDAWLEGHCAEWFSRASAYRWMATVRDLKAALASDDPTFEELKRAQLAAETLPRPWSDSTSPGPAPLFHLRLSLNAPPPEDWAPADRQDFLQQAKPVAELYARVQAIEEAA
jgi:hypothetical protein